MKKIFSVIVIVIVIVMPSRALAHGLAITQQQIVGEYLIEFEYQGVGQVLAGELTPYTFELLQKDTSEQVPYERMFLKISKQGASSPTFAANLVPVELLGRKSSRANITLGDVGLYTAELSFYNQNKELAKAQFIFSVEVNPASALPDKNNAKQYAYVGVFVVLILVIGIQTVWLYKKRNI